MTRGDKFPPIKLANVGGRLILVDGFHRLEAAKKAGRRTIEAEAAPMSEGQATLSAIRANATCGLPLSRADKKRCFQLYCESGSHARPDGSTKSLRQIRADLANIAWPNTISRWLRMEGIEPSVDGDGPSVSWLAGPDPDAEAYELAEDFKTQLAGIERLFHTMDDASHRHLAIQQLSTLSERLKTAELAGPTGLDV